MLLIKLMSKLVMIIEYSMSKLILFFIVIVIKRLMILH